MSDIELIEPVEGVLQKRVASDKPKFMVPIVDVLRNKTLKKGETNNFECNGAVMSYKTGIPPLDYYLGYRVNVYDENDDVVQSYPSIGITCGSFVTFIGKPSTSKTTTAVQISANIVRNFQNGFVIHYDLNK